MALGDILDGAIKLLRANARAILLIVATIVVPLDFIVAYFERNLNGGQGFLQVVHDPTAAAAQNGPSPVAVAALSFVLLWFILPLVCGAVSRLVMASYLGGEMKAQKALGAAVKCAPALLVATVIVHLAELIGVLGAGIGLFFVMPLFMMTAPAISLEELGPFAGVARSVRLARRRYWPTVGIALLSGVLAYVLNEALGLVPGALAVFIGLHWGWLILAGASVLQQLVTTSLITIVATLAYLDARIRQEGFDLQVLASRFDTAESVD
jgi:hypothetical protein